MVLLRARVPAPQGGPAGDGSLAPGIGGSAVASATIPVDGNGGLKIDPTAATAPTTRIINPTPNVNSPTSTQIPPLVPSDPTSLVSSTSTPTSAPSAPSSNNHTTIIIATVAGVAFVLIAIAALLLFCRAGRKAGKSPRSSPAHAEQNAHRGGGGWNEIESQQSSGGEPKPAMAQYYDYNYDHAPVPAPASAHQYAGPNHYGQPRPSTSAPSLHLDFEPEPLIAQNPFESPAQQPAPPLPQSPLMLREPPLSATGSRAPSDYSASYLRSMYSDSGSVHSSRRSMVLVKRSPSSKSRNQKELIALDKLIQALDINANDEKERMRQADPSNHNPQRESYIPPTFPLPPPAVFRAALGAGDED